MIPVHAESARVGARLALLVMQGKMPANDTVNNILAAGKDLSYQEFPLEVIGMVSGQRIERRRAFAMKALECLLVRSEGAGSMSNDELESLVTKAWHIAAAMEREDGVAQQLESLGKKS